MSDFDGVNLATVQALERRTSEQAEEIRHLQQEVEDLKRTLQKVVGGIPGP